MPEPVKGIARKLVAAMSEIDAVTKEGKNQAQGYNYVKAADVANEVRKVMVKHGIAFSYSVVGTERWQTDRIKDGVVFGVMNYVQLTIECSFRDTDSSEIVTVNGIGWGSDTGDKAPYKAMTGALKYALRMNFVIPDESDPENDANERKTPEEVMESAQRRAAQASQQLAQQQGAFQLEGDSLTCILKGIQKKETAKKVPYVSATFNGRLPNGCNFGTCFDKELWETLEKALDRVCTFKVKMNDKFVNIEDITDVRWDDDRTRVA